MTADILYSLPCHWQGTDDTTPDGCTLYVTTYLGIVTTYILRDGQVIGRVEVAGNRQDGYVGGRLKGGARVGSGDFVSVAQRIADRADKEG
jgi:hypothetical protein